MNPIHLSACSRAATVTTLILVAVLALLPAGSVRAEVTFTNLYSFGNDRNADTQPSGNLLQAADGSFYGTTLNTIFRVTTAGELTTIYPFDPAVGTYPRSPLVQTRDGSFYGTTNGGGTINGGGTTNGTIFRLAPDGTLTTLHTFTGTDGANPGAGLLLGADGNFYGSTTAGGASGAGTIFQLTPAGVFTVLHSFDMAAGSSPYGPMVRSVDGSLYGATELAGAAGEGTVFRLAADGTFTTLHIFTGADGSTPNGGLVQGPDGDLYGTTTGGGAANRGTVFSVTTAGVLTTLHEFNEADGAGPTSLIAASGGEFYGTTSAGGPLMGNFGSDYGTIYKLGSDGTFVTLHYFNTLDSSDPEGLVNARDGTLYGTTTGVRDLYTPTYSGTFYRLVTDHEPVLPVVTAATAAFGGNGSPDGEVDVLLTLSSTLTKPLKVHYVVKGSALPGADYQALSGVVKFKPLQNTQLIRVVATAAGQDYDTPPVVKIKLQPGSNYILSGSKVLKAVLYPEY